MLLQDLDDDVLIHLVSFLTIRAILNMRQTSRRFMTISKLHVVWKRAYHLHVLVQGFPFSSSTVDDLDSGELERRTRYAHALGQFWLSPSAVPHSVVEFAVSSGMPVSEVRFLPANPSWCITVSKGIWSVITCWDVGLSKSTRARKLAEWSPKGGVFTAVAINSDPDADAMLAVSTVFPNERRIDILRVVPATPHAPAQFECLATINSSFNAMNLRGNVLAISDDMDETHLIDWKTRNMAILWGSSEPSLHNFQHNRCLKVAFSLGCVFVVRARSLEAFTSPSLLPTSLITEPHQPIARHSFGWIDGVALSEGSQSKANSHPLSIVLRAESDDPWASIMHTLDLYHLPHTPHQTNDSEASERTQLPYTFPPLHHTSMPSTRGHLRCKDIALGAHGTAIWIQPRPARNSGLTEFDVHASDAQGSGLNPLTGSKIQRKEALVAAAFPGRLRDRNDAVGEGIRTLWEIDDVSVNWTSMDYDEARGLIALGDSHGKVMILQLASVGPDMDSGF